MRTQPAPQAASAAPIWWKATIQPNITGAFSLPDALLHFVLNSAAGIAIGLAVGWAVRPSTTVSTHTATAAIPGPTGEQLAAASSIPPSQQDQMVRAMVDGLAARLRQNSLQEKITAQWIGRCLKQMAPAA